MPGFSKSFRCRCCIHCYDIPKPSHSCSLDLDGYIWFQKDSVVSNYISSTRFLLPLLHNSPRKCIKLNYRINLWFWLQFYLINMHAFSFIYALSPCPNRILWRHICIYGVEVNFNTFSNFSVDGGEINWSLQLNLPQRNTSARWLES